MDSTPSTLSGAVTDSDRPTPNPLEPMASTPDSSPPTFIDLDKTPTMATRQHSLTSEASTTASSNYSSASSMARARAARAELDRIHHDDGYSDLAYYINGHDDCAPYLVPSHGPEMTLTWEPDPESSGIDPAEEVWKRLEVKMGRQLRPASIKDRGRWVAKAIEVDREDNGMYRQESDFSISAYCLPEDEEIVEIMEFGGEGTALFDMTAPLVPSVSTSADTPANTPCIRRETLQRTRHIRRRDGSSSASMSRSTSSDSRSDADYGSSMTTEQSNSVKSLAEDNGRMYRLDSHIVSALNALQGGFDSPMLDFALGLDTHKPMLMEDDDPEVYLDYLRDDGAGGLGLGIPLKNDSIYHLPTLSPSTRHTKALSLPNLKGFQKRPSREFVDEDDVLRVKDLDTGLIRALSMGELDGLA